MIQIGAVFLIEAALIFIAYRRLNLVGLNLFVVINMLAVLLAGEGTINYFIGASNLGNLFYGFVLSVVALITYLHGEYEAQKVVRYTAYGVAGFIALQYAALAFKMPDPTDSEVFSYHMVLAHQLGVVMPSMIGFASASMLLIFGLKHLPWSRTTNYLLAIAGAEVLDSLVFFYAIIGLLDFGKFLEFAWVGFIVKMGMHVAFLPLLLHILKSRESHDLVEAA